MKNTRHPFSGRREVDRKLQRHKPSSEENRRFSEAVEVFLDHDRVHANVVFNWRRQPVSDVIEYAYSYKNAAQALAAFMERDLVCSGQRSYPIVFLYRHAVELYLKALTHSAIQLHAARTGVFVLAPRLWKEHSLTRLLQLASPILAGLGPSYARALKGIEEAVVALDALDPGSFAFRYPITPKGKSTLPRHLVLNMFRLSEEMYRVFDALADIYRWLDNSHQKRRKARRRVVNH